MADFGTKEYRLTDVHRRFIGCAKFTSNGLELDGYAFGFSKRIEIINVSEVKSETTDLNLIMDDINRHINILVVNPVVDIEKNTLNVTFYFTRTYPSTQTRYIFNLWKKYELMKIDKTIIGEIIFAETPTVHGYQLDSTGKIQVTLKDFVTLGSTNESVVSEIYEGVQWIIPPVRAFIDENGDLKVNITIIKSKQQRYIYSLSFRPLKL